jgi:hypothetical protein
MFFGVYDSSAIVSNDQYSQSAMNELQESNSVCKNVLLGRVEKAKIDADALWCEK